jgi:hypothetical protein
VAAQGEPVGHAAQPAAGELELKDAAAMLLDLGVAGPLDGEPGAGLQQPARGAGALVADDALMAGDDALAGDGGGPQPPVGGGGEEGGGAAPPGGAPQADGGGALYAGEGGALLAGDGGALAGGDGAPAGGGVLRSLVDLEVGEFATAMARFIDQEPTSWYKICAAIKLQLGLEGGKRSTSLQRHIEGLYRVEIVGSGVKFYLK